MIRNLVLALVVIVPIAMSTFLIVSMRIEQIAEPEKIEEFGLDEVRNKDASDFGMLAAAFGVLVTIGYILASQRWPMTNELFAGMAIALAILMSLAAAYFRPQAGLAGVPEVIALNLIWGAGYGWLLPFVLHKFGQLAVI